jgi:hypothetical protein
MDACEERVRFLYRLAADRAVGAAVKFHDLFNHFLPSVEINV